MNAITYILPVIPITLGFVSTWICPISRDEVQENLRGLYVPPVWTLSLLWYAIYIFMGILMYLLLRQKVTHWYIWALLIVNIVLNLFWSPIYSRKCFNKQLIGFWWLIAIKLSLLILSTALILIDKPLLVLCLHIYMITVDTAIMFGYVRLNRT